MEENPITELKNHPVTKFIVKIMTIMEKIDTVLQKKIF